MRVARFAHGLLGASLAPRSSARACGFAARAPRAVRSLGTQSGGAASSNGEDGEAFEDKLSKYPQHKRATPDMGGEPLLNAKQHQALADELEALRKTGVGNMQMIPHSVKEKIYDLHVMNPDRWTVVRLSREFGIKMDRVKGIIRLRDYRSTMDQRYVNQEFAEALELPSTDFYEKGNHPPPDMARMRVGDFPGFRRYMGDFIDLEDPQLGDNTFLEVRDDEDMDEALQRIMATAPKTADAVGFKSDPDRYVNLNMRSRQRRGEVLSKGKYQKKGKKSRKRQPTRIKVVDI